MHSFGTRRAKDITKVAVEVLNVRIAAQSEFILAKAQSLQHDAVVENLRALKVGDCDIDMVDSSDFGHGMALTVNGRVSVRVLPHRAERGAAKCRCRSPTPCQPARCFTMTLELEGQRLENSRVFRIASGTCARSTLL